MADDDETGQAEALGRYADRVLARAPGNPAAGGVDPELAGTIDRLGAFVGRPAPPGVSNRVWARVTMEDDMTKASRKHIASDGSAIGPMPAPMGRGRETTASRRPVAELAGRAVRPRITSAVASAGLLAAALLAVAVLVGLSDLGGGPGGREAVVTAPTTVQAAVSPIATPAGGTVQLDRIGGGGGLWELPTDGRPVSIRLVRYTVAPGGTWVIPEREGRWLDWWIVEGMLYVPDGAPQTDWSPYDGYRQATMPGTELSNRRGTPAVVLEVRIEADMADLPTAAGTTVETIAGGSIGPVDGRLAAVQIETVWGSQIVDTTRGGAGLVVIGPESVTFHRDGGDIVTSGDAPTDDYGSLSLGAGAWALVSDGAAFHFDAAPPAGSSDGLTDGEPTGPTALIVTLAPNAAVVQEHEAPTPTPVP